MSKVLPGVPEESLHRVGYSAPGRNIGLRKCGVQVISRAKSITSASMGQDWSGTVRPFSGGCTRHGITYRRRGMSNGKGAHAWPATHGNETMRRVRPAYCVGPIE